MTGLGMTIGFLAGGGGGVAAAIATGGVASPAAVVGAAGGAALGGAAGLAASRRIGSFMFREGSSSGASGKDPAAGLRRQLGEHERRLEQYRANPDAFDNKGFLKNAPNEEARRRIIEGRIRNLQNQIENFRRQIQTIEGGGT